VRDAKGAYFTRGSGHDEAARYTESSETYPRVMDRLSRKYETARSLVPPPVVETVEGAEIGFLAFGSSHWALVEARDRLTAQSLKSSYLLLKALPFTADVPAIPHRPLAHLCGRAESGRADGGLAQGRIPAARRPESVRCCTTPGCRSPPGFVTGES
jgi:hypothetical protein